MSTFTSLKRHLPALGILGLFILVGFGAAPQSARADLGSDVMNALTGSSWTSTSDMFDGGGQGTSGTQHCTGSCPDSGSGGSGGSSGGTPYQTSVDTDFEVVTNSSAAATAMAVDLNNGSAGNGSQVAPRGYTAVVVSGPSSSGYYYHVVVVANPTDNGGTVPVPTVDYAPLGDMQATFGTDYQGPNLSCDSIQGWACDQDYPEAPVKIAIYVDGSSTVYSSFDTNLPNTGQDGQCGVSKSSMRSFKWITPNALKDGKSHTLQIKAKNQGPVGASNDVYLPNTSSFQAKNVNLTLPNCKVQKIDLAATVSVINDQYSSVPFANASTTISNRGTSAISDPIDVIFQIDKQTSTTTNDGWVFEGNGKNGDIQMSTTTNKDFAPDQTGKVSFGSVTLPVGEYRGRALVDNGRKIETASSTYLSNNASQWQYFSILTPPPAPDLLFSSITLGTTCNGEGVSKMTTSDQCPSTSVNFVLKNNGNKAIASGTNIPYHLEYHLPTDEQTAAWRSTATANYSTGIAIGATSNSISVSIANLPTGEVSIRAVVNPAPGTTALGEFNFANNVSGSVSVNYIPYSTELSFNSFAVTGTCDTHTMIDSTPCANTTVSFILQNAGNKPVTSGMNVPYQIQYKPSGGSSWITAVDSNYTGAIAAKSGSTNGKSTTVAAKVSGLKVGLTQLRGIVNPSPGKTSLNEKDFSNNTSNTISQNYMFDVGQVTLSAVDAILRYGSTVKLNWTVTADYDMTCQLLGDYESGTTKSFTTNGGSKQSGSVLSDFLKNTQTFSITCTPKSGPGVPPDVVSASTRVEIVPIVQEI